MAVPGHLALHGRKAADEEKLPLVEVDMVLVGGLAAGDFTAWAQAVGFIVCAQQIMNDSPAFPGRDAGVGVFEGGHAAVLADLEKIGAFDAVGCVAKAP